MDAPQRTFDVVELREAILEYLEPKDLVTKIRVCKGFRDSIYGSRKLRRRLFLDPPQADRNLRCTIDTRNPLLFEVCSQPTFGPQARAIDAPVRPKLLPPPCSLRGSAMHGTDSTASSHPRSHFEGRHLFHNLVPLPFHYYPLGAAAIITFEIPKASRDASGRVQVIPEPDFIKPAVHAPSFHAMHLSASFVTTSLNIRSMTAIDVFPTNLRIKPATVSTILRLAAALYNTAVAIHQRVQDCPALSREKIVAEWNWKEDFPQDLQEHVISKPHFHCQKPVGTT